MPLRAILAPLATLAIVLPASAAEVVWLGVAPADQRERVEAMPDYTGSVGAWAFRASGTALSPADDAAYARLASALEEVRPYELKLDGELVIMADLQVPIAAIDIVRTPDDRTALFRALAYQGFAVNRYFADALGSDDEAAPWRADVAGTLVEKPWRDAAALDPGREVTPYEIAEAPQRVAYEKVHETVGNALPGGLRVEGLPERALLYVDGEVRDDSASNVRVPPGRHFVHVEKEGHVLERWAVELEPAKTEMLAVDLTDEAWQGFARTVDVGSEVPEAIRKRVAARGGEVWFARAGAKDPVVLAVTEAGVTAVGVPRVKGSSGEPTNGGLSFAASVGGGWLSSGDFFLQEYPNAPETRGTVNSASIVPGVSAAYDIGLFRVGAGVDAAFTPGAFHYAKYGTSTTRLRPYPHVEVGTRYASVTAGWLFPHHPTGGLRAAVPLPAGFEIRGDARIGIGGDRTLESGDTYVIQPIYTAFASVGWRIRP